MSTSNERAIATQQTGFVLIAQMRSWLPDAVGGILWFGVDEPIRLSHAYVRLHHEIPEC